jgi:hypothetical protein
MDNKSNQIRRTISTLRAEMLRLQEVARDQINRDLDPVETASQVMSLRARIVTLVADWRSAGGTDRLPSIAGRLRGKHRDASSPHL